jgi:hypothetical protein
MVASVLITAFAHAFARWTLHGVLLLGSALIALSAYLSGTPSGIYAGMYVWVVLVAGRSFSRPGLLGQLTGIGGTYAIALSGLEAGPTEFPNETRWLLTVFALAVTGLISLRLTSDARRREADLIRLSALHKRQGEEAAAGISRAP